jgi:hypothetical protein
MKRLLNNESIINDEPLTFDAVSGRRVKKGEGKLIKLIVGFKEKEIDKRPSAIINGIRFVFPEDAKWLCCERNGVVYWSSVKSKMSKDEYTREPLGWGANKKPVFHTASDGFVRPVIRKDLQNDEWMNSWQRIPQACFRAKRFLVTESI